MVFIYVSFKYRKVCLSLGDVAIPKNTAYLGIYFILFFLVIFNSLVVENVTELHFSNLQFHGLR